MIERTLNVQKDELTILSIPKAQVAQAPLGAVNMTLHNRVAFEYNDHTKWTKWGLARKKKEEI